MSPEALGLVSLAALFGAIFVGFPIAFTLVFLALAFGYLGFENQVFYLMVLQVFSVMRDPTLAAVPFFLFMGYLLEQAGLMERLFKSFQMLLAPVKGSLYLAVLITATIFAAATGIVGASVTILGVMAAPTMMKGGYDVRLSAGSIAAGGTLGILIPPSVMLVVMGPVIGVPVTRLFAAAVVPGLLLAALYALYAVGRSYLDPRLGPALAHGERAASAGVALRELLAGVIPVSVLILATLGTILLGLATPTDAAAVGAFGAFALTVAYRRLGWAMFRDAALRTLETSSMILVLVAASNFFGAVFSRLGTAAMITEALLGLSLPPMALLVLTMLVIFVLAWPLEWVPIVLIIVPILLPLVNRLGFDPVWFGTLVAVNLQTAWLSPPVALSAYFLKGVVPRWELKDIYAGMMQFMVLQVVGLALILLIPALALWLPARLFP